MDCKNTVLSEPLLKNQKVNCPTSEGKTKQSYNDNFCLAKGLALHLLGKYKLEKDTAEIFKVLLCNGE